MPRYSGISRRSTFNSLLITKTHLSAVLPRAANPRLEARQAMRLVYVYIPPGPGICWKRISLD